MTLPGTDCARFFGASSLLEDLAQGQVVVVAEAQQADRKE